MVTFMKRRWLGVPVAMLLALAVVLAGGVAYAFSPWSGTAEVTVHECITVSCDSASSGSYDVGIGAWTGADMYPSESEWIMLKLSNASSAPITVTPSATLTGAPTGHGNHVTGAWDSPSYLVPAGGFTLAKFTATADESAVPGVYGWTLGFTR